MFAYFVRGSFSNWSRPPIHKSRLDALLRVDVGPGEEGAVGSFHGDCRASVKGPGDLTGRDVFEIVAPAQCFFVLGCSNEEKFSGDRFAGRGDDGGEAVGGDRAVIVAESCRETPIVMPGKVVMVWFAASEGAEGEEGQRLRGGEGETFRWGDFRTIGRRGHR